MEEPREYRSRYREFHPRPTGSPWPLTIFAIALLVAFMAAWFYKPFGWMQGGVPAAVQQTVGKIAPGSQESRSYSIERKTW